MCEIAGVIHERVEANKLRVYRLQGRESTIHPVDEKEKLILRSGDRFVLQTNDFTCYFLGVDRVDSSGEAAFHLFRISRGSMRFPERDQFLRGKSQGVSFPQTLDDEFLRQVLDSLVHKGACALVA